MSRNKAKKTATRLVCGACGHEMFVESAFVLSTRCCTATRNPDGSVAVDYLDTPEVDGRAAIACANCHSELNGPDDLVAVGTPLRRPEWAHRPPGNDNLDPGTLVMLEEIRRCDPDRFDAIIDRVRTAT